MTVQSWSNFIPIKTELHAHAVGHVVLEKVEGGHTYNSSMNGYGLPV
jgi:hypothetical protein